MLLKEFDFLHSTLQEEISFIDIAHVPSLFLGHNDKVLKQKSTIQQMKFNKLLKEKKTQHDPDKIILTILAMFYQKWKTLFFRRASFRILSKNLNHADYLVNFELFYTDICNLQVLSAEDLDFLKIKTKDIALSSFRNYSNNVPQYLSKGEFDALKSLKTSKSSFKNLTKVFL